MAIVSRGTYVHQLNAWTRIFGHHPVGDLGSPGSTEASATWSPLPSSTAARAAVWVSSPAAAGRWPPRWGRPPVVALMCRKKRRGQGPKSMVYECLWYFSIVHGMSHCGDAVLEELQDGSTFKIQGTTRFTLMNPLIFFSMKWVASRPL